MLSGLSDKGVGIAMSARRVARAYRQDFSHFFEFWPELFFRFRDYIGRPTHDRSVALRQTVRIPREGKRRRREDLARLLFHFRCNSIPSFIPKKTIRSLV